MWHTIKGYVAGAVAFVTCPCHLVLTLPLVLLLTGGTAVGAWLAANTVAIVVVFTLSFLVSLALAGKWLVRDKAQAPIADDSPAEVELVSSHTCSSCSDAAVT